MTLLRFSFVLTLFLFPLLAEEFSQEMHSRIAPYLLPENHPIKSQLDALFGTFRVTESDASLEEAGFTVLFKKKTSFITVAKHESFPGYIFKIYLDDETNLKENLPAWHWLANRCEAALWIRNLIQKQNMKHFKAPEKWLYQVPPLRTRSPIQQPVILVETDMKLASDKKTKKAWLTLSDKTVIKELYTILSTGYGSSFLTANVPYTKSGYFAFIDTEHPHKLIDMRRVKKFISPKMAAYWDSLSP